MTLTINRFGFTVCTDGLRFYLLGNITGWWLFWELSYSKEYIRRSNPSGAFLKTVGPLSESNACILIPKFPENVAWNPLVITA